jgi:hypothetical protein
MALTLRELKTARSFLRQAQMLIAGVSSLFFNASDAKTSARLNDLITRLTDEIGLIERRIRNLHKEENA